MIASGQNKHNSVLRANKDLSSFATMIASKLMAKGNMPRFRGLCDFDYGDLASIVQAENFADGSFVYRKGDRADKVYSLTSGLLAEEVDTTSIDQYASREICPEIVVEETEQIDQLSRQSSLFSTVQKTSIFECDESLLE